MTSLGIKPRIFDYFRFIGDQNPFSFKKKSFFFSYVYSQKEKFQPNLPEQKTPMFSIKK